MCMMRVTQGQNTHIQEAHTHTHRANHSVISARLLLNLELKVSAPIMTLIIHLGISGEEGWFAFCLVWLLVPVASLEPIFLGTFWILFKFTFGVCFGQSDLIINDRYGYRGSNNRVCYQRRSLTRNVEATESKFQLLTADWEHHHQHGHNTQHMTSSLNAHQRAAKATETIVVW